MPVKSGNNPVNAAIAAMKKVAPGADKKYRDKPVEVRSGMLPTGLRGIAKLSGFKVAVKEDGFYKGKPFVAFRGVVKKCTDNTGMDYRGSLFYTEIVIADSRSFGKKPGRKAEVKVGDIENTMKILGAELSEATYDDWPGIMEDLIEEGTHFHFRTWSSEVTKQQPNPRVNQEIVRLAEEFVDEETSDVTDDTEVEVLEDDAEEASLDTDDDEVSVDEVLEEESNDDKVSEDEDEQDYIALAAIADSNDKKKKAEALEAAGVIEEAASKAGIAFEEADSWLEVAKELMLGKTNGSEETDEEEEAETTPVKGDVVGYRPIDAKTKKLSKKKAECEVMLVDKRKKLVTLKNLENNKVIKNVPWDKLL